MLVIRVKLVSPWNLLAPSINRIREKMNWKDSTAKISLHHLTATPAVRWDSQPNGLIIIIQAVNQMLMLSEVKTIRC